MDAKPPFVTTPLAAALGYTTLGWRIHPTHHNDDHRPHLKGWPTLATTEQAQIRTWWSYWPDATPAMALDPPMVVIDLDVKHGVDGTAAFRRLVGCSPLDFETPTSETPSGGLHLYFQCTTPLRNSVGKLAPGIDLRAPVSSVPLPSGSNARKWLKPPCAVLAPLPDSVVERAQHSVESTLAPAPVAEFQGFIRPEALQMVERAVKLIVDAVPGTQEHTLSQWAFTIGGLIGAGELPFELTAAALVDAGLQMRAGDPFRPWTQWQIENKVDGALRRGMTKPWLTIEALEERLNNINRGSQFQ